MSIKEQVLNKIKEKCENHPRLCTGLKHASLVGAGGLIFLAGKKYQAVVDHKLTKEQEKEVQDIEKEILNKTGYNLKPANDTSTTKDNNSVQ